MNRASELLVVHLSARLLSFMPTFLLLYSCNLFWCDTKCILNVQPPPEENNKPFLYSVGCSLYLHWWRSLMPSGCNLCNRLNSPALVGLIYFLVFFFPGLLVAATTMGHIRAVGSMGHLRAINKWACNRWASGCRINGFTWAIIGRNWYQPNTVIGR